MSDNTSTEFRIRRENERLARLVDELKADNALMTRTLEAGTAYTESLSTQYRALLERCRALAEQLEARDNAFFDSPSEEPKWGIN